MMETQARSMAWPIAYWGVLERGDWLVDRTGEWEQSGAWGLRAGMAFGGVLEVASLGIAEETGRQNVGYGVMELARTWDV